MSAATNAAQIEALRAGREATSTIADLHRGTRTTDLLVALDKQPSVGVEFAIVRELRRRRQRATGVGR